MQEVKQHQTLPELAVDFLTYMQVMESNGGELTPEWEAFETALMSDLSEKADSIFYLIKRLEALAEADKSDAATLLASANTKLNAVTRIKDRMKYVMSSTGMTSLHGNAARFTLVNSRSSLKIDDALLPAEYWRTVSKKEPDKEMIRTELELGHEVNGARLEQGVSLRMNLGRK